MLRLNDLKWAIYLSFSAATLMPYLARANVETIAVRQGDVISKDISINPGFAVMFQFPQDVQALTLADQTAFACDKMPSDFSRILCKPLTQSPFMTNLVVSTAQNEFNLILNVDSSGKKHPFKYVFTDGKSVSSYKPIANRHQQNGSTSLPSSNLLDLILDHYNTLSCRARGESSLLRFRCIEIIEVGTERYLRFSLTGIGSEPIKVLKMSLSSENLGGLTGLSISEESSIDIDFSLKQENLGRAEESLGVVKLPRIESSKGKRLGLVVMTDQGQKGDLRIYGF